jgi:2-amino-4-hydroxy-6-hydroxymethyldihydropteridine diphosphokinase
VEVLVFSSAMKVLIGLGANLGDPPRALRQAVEALADSHEVIAVSSLYGTRAVGPPQPDYVNGAALLETGADPLALLEECRSIEKAVGRRREAEQRWGPRVLDLDLLMVEGVVRRGPRLELPHPRFHQRAFALVPAAELVPSWTHPLLGRTIEDLADEALREEPDSVVVFSRR